MKKILTLSLAIVFSGVAFSQTKPMSSLNKLEQMLGSTKTKPPVVKVEPIAKVVAPVVKVEPIAKVVAPVVKVEPIAKVVAPVVKVEPTAKVVAPVVKIEPTAKVAVLSKSKIKKHKIKNASKPISSTPIVIERIEYKTPVVQAVLLNTEYYHIPNNTKESDLAKFLTPISYSDVDVKITKTENPSVFNFLLIDKRTTNNLNEFYLSNSPIVVASINSDLSSAKINNVKYGTQFNNITLNQNSCQLIYVSYQLKNIESPFVSSIFIDKDGKLTDSLPSLCKSPNIDSKDTSFYTKNGNIVNIGFNQKFTTHGNLAFNAHFSEEGHDYIPQNITGLAIPTDFSTLYQLSTDKNNTPFFGVKFNKTVPNNSYYVLLGFDTENNQEWFQSKTTVTK